MRKNRILPLFLLLFALLLAFTALGAEKTVYVDADYGSDANNGLDEANAFATLGKAIEAVRDGGTVCLLSPYEITTDIANGVYGFTEPEHTGEIVITAKYPAAKLIFTMEEGGPASTTIVQYRMSGPTTFRKITLSSASFAGVVAQFHPVVFDEDVSVVNGSKYFFVIGGYESPTAEQNATDKDSYITFNSGDFYKVCGFSRSRGAATLTYTGTSHFTVNGGSVAGIYCASMVNHYGGSTEVTVNGGKVGVIYTGGDATRQLSGSAKVYLNGGSVPKLHINNTVGNADVYLRGTELGSNVAITYSNDTIAAAAQKARSVKTLHCETALYSASQVESLRAIFEAFDNLAEGSASGSDLAVEIAKLSVAGGKLNVSGDTRLSSNATVGGTLTLVGDGKATVTLEQSLKLSGSFELEHLTLKAAKPVTITVDGDLAIGEGVTVDGEITLVGGSGSISVASGSFAAASGSSVILTGGGIGKITLPTDNISAATILIAGGEAGEIDLAGSLIREALTLRLRGGKVGKVTLGATSANVVCEMGGATVGSFTVEGVLANGVLYGENLDPALQGKFARSETAQRTVYLAGGGKGDGASAATPVGNINDAISALGGAGTVVVCGPYTVSSAYVVNEHAGKVTFTSKDSVTDYRESGAAITFDANILFGGETEFCEINFKAPRSATLFAGGHKFTIGKEVETECINGTSTYHSIVGGYNRDTGARTSDITIESGDWNMVRGGYNAVGLTGEGFVNRVTVTGGRFHGYFACGSRGATSGVIEVNISGGVFYQGLCALYEEDNYTYDLHYDVTMNISGGEIHGFLAPAKSYKTVLHGSYTVNLTGGSFGHLCDLAGTADFGGDMVSTLRISGVDITKKESGETSFTNPIRYNNADPYLFYYDGFYYYTCTGSTTIGMIKAANLADIKTLPAYTVLKPTYGKNLWSPEVHYFTAAEVGEENAGWYMFISFDDGTTANQRSYVVKCLDGDNLLGRWGDPVTGEVNVPRHVDFVDTPSLNSDQLGGGLSVSRINGKTYLTFISEEGRGTSDFHQTVNLCEFENPWTIVGTPTVICRPTEQWEFGGYGQDAAGNWYPKVVEGSSAVYGTDGSFYQMYTGSGYWTAYYALNYLIFKGGDPMDAANWEKKANGPIFSQSSEVTGSGHASYMTDEFGTMWASYHGYLAKDGSNAKRYSYFEPMTVDATGVTIGDGSGHPASLATVYTVPMNTTPLEKKISGFGSVENAGKTVVKLTIGKAVGTVNGAEKPLDAAPIIRNSRTMLPVRFLAEAFGAQVGWDGATSTATITADGVNIAITIGAATAQINGETVALDSPAFIENSRTYLPVRVIADALGAAVEWDGATSTATLTK